MRVLVTGASGFLGQALVRRLMQEKCVKQIAGVSRRGKLHYADTNYDEVGAYYYDVFCDLLNENAVASLLSLVRPDCIFHFAANPLVRDTSPDVTRANTLATHYLLHHAFPMTRFVFASSATVYGDSTSIASPAKEDSPLQPNSVYGASKLASESLVNAYHLSGNVSGLSLRLVANVGPNATHGVVKDILQKLKRQDTAFLNLLGDAPGSNKHYTHIDDTIEAVVQFGLNPAIVGAVNVANDDGLTVEELANVIMNTTGEKRRISWEGEAANWRGDNRIVRVDNSKAKSLGWQPKYPKSADAVAAAIMRV